MAAVSHHQRSPFWEMFQDIIFLQLSARSCNPTQPHHFSYQET